MLLILFKKSLTKNFPKSNYVGLGVNCLGPIAIVGIISLYLNSPARAAANKPALQSLLLALATTKSKILSDNTYLNALPEIVKYRQSWLNHPQTWRPQKKNVRKQFASLLRHLLAKYPVPLFMDSAWTSQPLYPRFQKWWIHIAQGGSLRKRDDLPFKPFTKKIAHHFLQAPHSFSICEALRWGQIHALGGNERIARGICTTFLARDYTTFNRNTFWESVLRFFIANPMLDTQQYGPVCDYLNNQKFVTPYGAEGPPQPNLSMKDRQADALVRQVETWHAQLGRFEKFSRCPPNWNHHPTIKDWEYHQKSEKNPKLYRIIQLLSRAELKEEGRRLDHCVYSYGYSCASGRTSIWSLQEIFPNNSIDHLGTIEVANAESRIVQFRAKYNREPKPKAKTLLKRWASENGLSLARWL